MGEEEELQTDTPSITIAVAAHKSADMPVDPVYLPMQVGAELGSLEKNALLSMSQDNTGDNISRLNPYFSELTALYWLWKNCDSDYKGLTQYRRHFASSSFFRRHSFPRSNRIITKDELNKELHISSIILPRKRHYVIETVYSHYDHTLHAEQLLNARDVLQDLEPSYVAAWDSLMESRSAHLFNMLVMDREHFDAYCSWLFPILFELIKRVDPAQYDQFHARYPGRISELLLNVWITTNRLSYRELPVTTPTPINWIKKGTSFLMAKYAGKKYTHSF